MVRLIVLYYRKTLDHYVKTFTCSSSGKSAIFPSANSRFVQIKGTFVLCDRPTPMVGVKGRHEARKRVCHRANTFQRAAPEFHDRVSGQQHVGTQPWGLPVLGPCQWHRPYRARSRSNRARTSVDGGARGAPSPVDGTFSVGAQ